MLKKTFVLALIFCITLLSHSQPKGVPVTQTITYKTEKADEIYLLWTLNNWKLPEEKFWPAGTYIKDGMAYTKMNKTESGFSQRLTLPAGTYVDCMFWVTKDNEGNDADGWDTNWSSNYNLFVGPQPKEKVFNDEKLAFVIKKKEKTFSTLKEGRTILFASLLFSGIVFLFIFIKNKTIRFRPFRFHHFFIGLLLSTFLLMLLVRLEMNGFIFKKQYLVFGSGFYDLLFLSFFSLFLFALLHVAKKRRVYQLIVQTFAVLLVTSVALFSLMNIEIVKQLGKPLNYQWLYYSDFLKATDAKNALKNAANTGFYLNVIFLLLALVITAYAFSRLLNKLKPTWKKTYLPVLIMLLSFAGIGFYQLKENKFDSAKIDNPVYVLSVSWINTGSKPALFSLKVNADTKSKIEEIHQRSRYEKLSGSDTIKNVIFFVMESTPANLVQLYDSTYKVTPYLNEWKKYGVVYDHIYAHLPNTVSSVFSLTAGMYPMISYKSIISEYPHLSLPTLPQVLKQSGWKTSLFFSSDLSYGNIDVFVKNHGYETAEDFKTIKCTYKNFESNYAKLDGLDDRCLVSRYFTWKDSLKAPQTFSVLWTNQTHYPYFSHNKTEYSKTAELNPYLNALKNVDEAFNQLMQGLKERNSLGNTLVVIVGDHGEAFGTHSQFTHASKIYEENLHIPCLFINPVLFNGSGNNKLGGLIDIAPTILHVLNKPVPSEWEGVSLLSNKQKTHSFFIGPFSDFLFGSRFRNWKFIYNASSNQYELYDVVKDPKELTNVADKHSEIVSHEYEMLAGWVQYHTRKVDSLVRRK